MGTGSPAILTVSPAPSFAAKAAPTPKPDLFPLLPFRAQTLRAPAPVPVIARGFDGEWQVSTGDCKQIGIAAHQHGGMSGERQTQEDRVAGIPAMRQRQGVG